MMNLSLINAANTWSVVKIKCAKAAMVFNSFTVQCSVRYKLRKVNKDCK